MIKSPLKDTLLSNSPAHPRGYDHPNTSPLRIAKRTPSPTVPRRSTRINANNNHHHHSGSSSHLPSAIARRSSSSYRHLRNNNLVSKSPFKSQIPTPASVSFPASPPPPTPPRPSSKPATKTERKVSGEKRPRPSSIHDQAEAENDRPLFAYKRDRKQSKGFQGLIEKEPVTKSPFRQPTLPPPPMPSTDESGAATTATVEHQSASTATPTRSSLVSKRLHGPRHSGGHGGGHGGGTGKRVRRKKTVTFDERCDVVEFDAEEDGEDGDSLEDSEGEEEEESFDQLDNEAGEVGETETGEETDPDTSLTTQLESLIHQSSSSGDDILAHAQSLLAPNATPRRRSLTPTPSTPPSAGNRSGEFAVNGGMSRVSEDEGEDEREDSVGGGGIPMIGVRSERSLPPVPALTSADDDPFTISHSLQDQDRDPDQSFTSVSLGDLSQDLNPEPGAGARIEGRPEASFEGLERSFGTGIGLGLDLDFGDVFNLAGSGNGLRDEVEEVSSKVIPSPFMRSLNSSPALRKTAATATTSTPPRSRSKPSPMLPPIPRIASPPTVMRNTSSPRIHVSSPAGGRISSPLVDVSSSGGGRQRISREEVKKRLMRGRNADEEEDVEDTEVEDRDEEEKDISNSNSNRLSVFTQDSRLSSISTESAVVHTAESATLHVAEIVDGGGVARGGTPLRREDNYTYDGVISIDPGVQEIDPPRPELGKRAMTLTTWEMGELDFGSMNMSMRLSFGGGGGEMGAREGDVDVDMRSALDRLMDDVAGGSASDGADADTRRMMERERERMGKKRMLETPDDSMVTEDDEVSAASSFSHHAAHPSASFAAVERSVVMEEGIGIEVGGGLSRTASGSTIPPPPPPKENVSGKDARKEREKMIIEKRRMMRRLEEEESLGFISPPRLSIRIGNKGAGGARMNRRRSRSTGDVRDGLLNAGVDGGELGDSIERELRKMGGEKSKYHVREHQGTIYASSSDNSRPSRNGGGDRIGHIGSAGDVDGGNAWRMVRRPSDMNEYSKQIKEFRAQEKPGKAHGKVFVKVLCMKNLNLPIPQQATAVTCTLNNGIHFVTTPECELGKDSKIEQEFELIEHSKLEFTLTLKIRRDAHIITQFKAIAPPPPAASQPVPASKGGMRSFFSSSPKKSKDKAIAIATRSQSLFPPKYQLPENLARYLKADGTLARAFISFKDVASRCDTRLFETSYPLIGQKAEIGISGAITATTTQIGEIVLQMFRLPPLPGIPPEKLPQSLEECHRGLRHINWHKVTYFEGVLTQNGGDCTTWRRRQLRVIGANLVAFNDVTKKATATIDLKKATAVEDDQQRKANGTDDYEGLYGVERSFRLIFPHQQEIVFFADTDDEKAKWLEVLRALVGHIPPNPLWAELIWQRQDELAKRARETTTSAQHPHVSLKNASRP